MPLFPWIFNTDRRKIFSFKIVPRDVLCTSPVLGCLLPFANSNVYKNAVGGLCKQTMQLPEKITAQLPLSAFRVLLKIGAYSRWKGAKKEEEKKGAVHIMLDRRFGWLGVWLLPPSPRNAYFACKLLQILQFLQILQLSFIKPCVWLLKHSASLTADSFSFFQHYL